LLLIAYSNGQSPTVMEIKRSFALDEWISSGHDDSLPDVEALSSALLRFNSEAEIDLGQVQSLLARYFSPQGGQVDVLDRLVTRLDSLRVAAERNELDVLRRLIDSLTEVVAAIRDGKVRNLEQGSMQMAGALLFIQDSGAGIRPGPEWKGQAEASISALREVIDSPGGDGDEVPQMPISLPSAATTDGVARAAAIEVRSELQYVEHALEQVANGDAPLSQLRGAEAHLKRIEGTLEILEQPAAAMLAEKLRVAVRGVVGAEPLQPRSLDALAMAVGTLGVCADELGNGGTLERMESTIARAVAELAGIGDAKESELRQVHLELVDPAAHTGAEQPGAFDSVESLELELDSPTVDVDRSLPLNDYSTSLDIDDDEFEFDDDALPPVASVESGDDELVDVFFQEANEIEPLIQKDKERWRRNPDDESALSDLRRGFHTLKGSGRFAEATSIAELSFIVEELLNRVIDGEQEPSATIHGFVDRAHRALAELIARRDVGDSVDLAVWQREADAAASGTPVEEGDFSRDLGNELLGFQLPGVPPASTPASTPASAAPDDAESPVGAVFLDELDGHIAVIAGSVSEARSVFPHWNISDALLRTSHTLRGVFRSVGLRAAASMADALDDLLSFKQHGDHSLEEVDLVLVDQSGRLMRYASNKLGPQIEMSSDLALQFEELAAALRQRLSYLGENAPELPAQSTDAELDEFVSAAPSAPRQAQGYGEEDELVEAFREEGQEIMARLGQDVDRWRSGTPASHVLSSMRRELHTFKGGARTVGWTLLGDLAHNAETLLENERLTRIRPAARLRPGPGDPRSVHGSGFLCAGSDEFRA
jgi:chemosensory pili system protein ChpA (sensor histidine kinase/response regulator)